MAKGYFLSFKKIFKANLILSFYRNPSISQKKLQKHTKEYLDLRNTLQKNKNYSAEPKAKPPNIEAPLFPKILKEMRSFEEEEDPENDISIGNFINQKENRDLFLLVINIKSVEIFIRENFNTPERVFLKVFWIDLCRITSIAVSQGRCFTWNKSVFFKRNGKINESISLTIEVWVSIYALKFYS